MPKNKGKKTRVGEEDGERKVLSAGGKVEVESSSSFSSSSYPDVPLALLHTRQDTSEKNLNSSKEYNLPSPSQTSQELESVYDVLERERKEWGVEREWLLRALSLQQEELHHQSEAIYNKASDMAREFARSISVFEQRIEQLEQQVTDQRHIQQASCENREVLHRLQVVSPLPSPSFLFIFLVFSHRQSKKSWISC